MTIRQDDCACLLLQKIQQFILATCYIQTWVVVKIMVTFWVLIIISLSVAQSESASETTRQQPW